MGEVIDLTDSPPRHKRRCPEAAESGQEDRLVPDCQFTAASHATRQERLWQRVHEILPLADRATVASVLADRCMLLDDDKAVELAVLFFLSGGVTDAELASRLAEEERETAKITDREMACQFEMQDRESGRGSAEQPFGANCKPQEEQSGKLRGVMEGLLGCLSHDEAAAGMENYLTYVCSDVVMYRSVHGVDSGWGCGYRNTQMLISHLLARSAPASGAHPYRSKLFSGSNFVPSISSLQDTAEEAWAQG